MIDKSAGCLNSQKAISNLSLLKKIVIPYPVPDPSLFSESPPDWQLTDIEYLKNKPEAC